jgi:hypothetical protein
MQVRMGIAPPTQCAASYQLVARYVGMSRALAPHIAVPRQCGGISQIPPINPSLGLGWCASR